MSHYIVSESLAGEIGSQFLTPPDSAKQTKWGKRWDTEAVIEDIVFNVDAENPLVEKLRVVLRVPSDAMSNQGRGFSEFFNFHWDAVEADSPSNLVMRTKISY